MNTAKRRPRVGFQITQLGIDYCNMYLHAIRQSCREAGADLIVFAGGSLLAPHSFDYQQNTIYTYMNPDNVDVLILLTATMRNYAEKPQFDEFFATISKVPVINISFPVEGYASLITDNVSGIDQIIRHLANVHGCRRIAFIRGPENNQEAQQRFMTYRDAIADCELEIDPQLVCQGDFTPRSGTKAVNILIDERKAHFDAIVAANDDMALAAMQALQERGINVPYEVAVTGFDDILHSAYTDPGLTTVRQPFSAQAKKAVELALKSISGGDVPTELLTFPTDMVLRSSCGCVPRSLDVFDEAFKIIVAAEKDREEKTLKKCLEYVARLDCPPEITERARNEGVSYLYLLFGKASASEAETKAFLASVQSFASRRDQAPAQLFFWEQAVGIISAYITGENANDEDIARTREKARILFREARTLVQNRQQYRLMDESDKFQGIMQLLLLTRDLSDLVSVLPQILPSLDIRNFFLVLHKPVKPQADALPSGFIEGRDLLLAVRDNRKIDSVLMKIEGCELLPKNLMDSMQDYQEVAAPLFYREELFGYVCFEPGDYSMNLYHNLILELGSVIKRCLLGTEQKKTENKLRDALQKLKESNQKLADQSQTDELTRLYNRRGFLELATHSLLFAQRMKKTALLIFIDLDGLKTINDTWGHAAGDTAIMGTALVLKATFRQVDIISRLGGDEFIVLTLDSPLTTKEIILDRLNNNVNTFNASGTNKWDLSMSVGVLEIASDDMRPLPDLMHLADELQYIEKAKKRKKNSESGEPIG